MSVDRRVSLGAAIRYRGGGTMWTWILHRVSGVAMILFISLHVLAGFLSQQWGSNIGFFINSVYQSLAFQIFIYFCVLFHVTNGLRIIALDFYPKLLSYQREVTWLQWLIFLPIYGLSVFIMISRSMIIP